MKKRKEKSMKKKTMKRVLALVLASAMSMSSIAFAAGPETKRQKTSKADSGTWKIQDWGGTSDITLQNGWIEPTENGFVLDYEKIIKDRGKEGLVLYDSKAEEYKDSILELDLTVNKGEDDTQVGFYSVALLPRFVNGAKGKR
ncbi:MAG: acid shock protein [Clostridiales bacterium]|nr:acid shock protein [Clostridiales bacterium]